MLKGKNAVITGARKGIGRAITGLFAQNGCNIWACARTKDNDFETDMYKLSKEYGVFIKPVYFDLTNEADTKEQITAIIKENLPIDILVNNAGVAHGGLCQMTPVSEIKKIFDNNLYAHISITQLVLKAMTRKRSGSIINMASVSGLDLNSGNCAYGVSKAAMIAFTKTLSKEVGAYGIRVNAIAPGLTDTDMAALMEKKAGDEMVGSSTQNRLATPEEIANTALFFASGLSSFVSGQVLRVDGGAK